MRTFSSIMNHHMRGRGALRALRGLVMALPALLLLCSLSACSDMNKVKYSRFVALDPEGWMKMQQCMFDLSEDDSLRFADPRARYNLIVTVRHTTAFPYNNLWLNFDELTPADTLRSSAVELSLTTPSGAWKGHAVQGIYEFTDTVRRAVPLYPGCILYIRHDMPAETLPGILDLGLTVEQAD